MNDESFPPQEREAYKPPTSAEELFHRYKRGERYFRRAQLRGADLSSVFGGRAATADFRNPDPWLVDLERFHSLTEPDSAMGFADLSESDFRAANLEGLNLNHTIFWRTDFRGANLRGSDLAGCILIQAKCYPLTKDSLEELGILNSHFRHTDMSGAKFFGAYLQGANLRYANLEGARLDHAHIQAARLSHANLRHTDLTESNLAGADLRCAHLSGAIFNKTILEDDPWKREGGPDFVKPMLDGLVRSRENVERYANLENAICEGTDFRGVRGLRLDSTFVKDSRFSPTATDPWSTLRRKYTGAMFGLNILLLVAFLIPHVADSVFWSAIGRGQDVLTKVNFSPCLVVNCESWLLWQILLGIHRGVVYGFVAALLLTYNASRAILTLRVGLLRDQEERSGYSPSWPAYRLLYQTHIWIMRPLVIIVVGYFLWHLSDLLFAKISLPSSRAF